MKILNRRVIRVINQEKIQYLAVALVIVMGLTSYIGMGMAVENLDLTVRDYYRLTDFADGYIDFGKISKSQLGAVAREPGVEKIQGRITCDIQLDLDEEHVKVRMITNPGEEGINRLHFERGPETLEGDEEIFVLRQFAQARGYAPGDELPVRVAGKTYIMRIKNIVDAPEFVYLVESEQTLLPDARRYGVIYVTESFAQSALGFQGSYNQVLLRVEAGHEEKEVLDGMGEDFKNLGITGLTEKKNQLSHRMLTEEINGVRAMINVIPTIFLGVAAVILSFLINRLIKKDRTMIGILKAMGYGNAAIVCHYGKISLTIGMVGGVLGILAGFQASSFLAALYVESFFNIPILVTVFYPGFAFKALVLTLIFTLMASLWATRGILQIHPAESMRPPAPAVGKKILLEKWHFLWNRLDFNWKNVIRSAMRSKRRLVFTMVGVAMTYSLTLMPFSMLDLYDEMFVEQFEVFQTMDYSVNFSAMVSDKGILDLGKATGAEVIEGKLEIPFEVHRGSRERVVTMVGLEKDTVMYHFESPLKSPLELPGEGVLITESMHNHFGFEVGDRIDLTSFLPGKSDAVVTVKGIVKQTLGINMYADIGFMQRELAAKGLINGVFINTDREIKEVLDDYPGVASVQSLKDIRDSFMEFMDYTIYSILVMTFFAAILGFAIIYNASLMSIGERSLEFSAMRVMGFTKFEIFQLITREILIVTFFGLIMGIPMGSAMLYSIGATFNNDLYTMTMKATPIAHLKTAALTGVFIALSVLATYEKIHRLNFMDALKNRMT
ncbi:MAG: hypothetical protein AVO33_07220 [delta proteobacterium ML8_F1]|nr:MAG: hypothetical protein AVO33_07220 [delta proteobacterium ML8_F1]